ncbi:sodium:solute symporter [Rhodopseudomonas palustris]|uniref:Sodium:solute symporter n=1 Tax=Rhodopseudomonas palustris TaxID=1076 RepID=A0A418V1Q1_RHOPL|nr:sodium:solute symporter [Rhodopseudomonas palustris]RJF69822.1 sodium:solute symporter [Rhodopseudomonas palustris]
MANVDLLVIAAAALSTVVIWLGVVVQGRIAAALASRH